MLSVDYEQEYRERYKDETLKNIIIFRSGPMPENYLKGMDFDDNARALFEYALSIKLYEKYELVWFVKDPTEWESGFCHYENVKFISYEDAYSDNPKKKDAYYSKLCLAKYIFMTDTYGFALNAREDQIRIMLWHGCGFKTRLSNNSCKDKYEYMTVTGDEYAKVHARIYGLSDDQILVTGYPKVDYIFHPLQDWQKVLNVPKANKYIFWLPTFRNTQIVGLERLNLTLPTGEIGLPVIKDFHQLKELNEILAANDTVMLIKLHPFQDPASICDMEGFSNICMLAHKRLVDHDVQFNHILGYADAIISDYSSVAVDYLVLDRPIAFTLDDMETYDKERGFVWDDVKKWLPGVEIYTYEDFTMFIESVIAGEDIGKSKRDSISRKMQKYRDDKNSARVLKALGIV